MISHAARKDFLQNVRRVVVKVGSSVLTDAATVINFNAFAGLVDQIAGMKSEGYEPVIISSGAIAIGVRRLGLKDRPQNIPLKQAAAAVGQTGLMENYDRFFKDKNVKVGQVLLTNLILKDRSLFLNARNTLFTLLNLGVIPIVNENDSVVVDEIKMGDNDDLAVIAANLVEADLLVILTDQDGLFAADPQKDREAPLIRLVEKIDRTVEKLAGKAKSRHGVGGMKTKILAAKKASKAGIPVIIANGRIHGTLEAILRGEDVGTLFVPEASKITGRKNWIAYALKPKGSLIIDDGAQDALLRKGKSLLAIGITKVEGDFRFGDSVGVFDQKGTEIARGLVNYNTRELTKIIGSSTQEIEGILGYKYYDEVVHRDDLVVF
jgi:glutamate 5-kinase